MIGEILLFIIIAWIASIVICVLIMVFDDVYEDNTDNSIILLFPANLIFIIKYWWKAIIKAIKS